MAKPKTYKAALRQLHRFGLAYPGAHTKSPWPGHMDLAVNDKTFAYLSVEGEPLSVSCKLPHSSDDALALSFTKPTGYGLGRSGWVTATFDDATPPPVELLKAWIDESYRAQAPKKLSKQLDQAPTRASAPTQSTRKKKSKTAARTSAGYSGTPLAKKLGVKADSSLAVIGDPGHFDELVAPLPANVTQRSTARGKADTAIFFTKKRSEFARRLDGLGRLIFPAGSLWIAWPKKASKVATDMTDDVIREVALPKGLVDVKVCAVDETWSGLKLMWRKDRR